MPPKGKAPYAPLARPPHCPCCCFSCRTTCALLTAFIALQLMAPQDAVEVIPEESAKSSAMLPRSPPVSLNPLRVIANLWSGSDTKTACAHEEALLSHFVKAPFKLGRVAIDLPELGLGRQWIVTLDVCAPRSSNLRFRVARSSRV